jgi:hypothetical protein
MLIVLKAVAAKEAVPQERCREEEEEGWVGERVGVV